MSFWTGFACGVAATYALSIAVMVYLVRKSGRSDYVSLPPRASCPEYPTVHFTHVTSIGQRVHGSD